MIKFLIITLSFSIVGFSASKIGGEKLTYRSYFGSCPKKVAGSLTLKLLKTFEKNSSLHDVKKAIVYENLMQKHFLHDYKINYDPLKKFMTFSFDCPAPLMKVQIYKEDGLETYSAILVETGELFDPTYEVLLRTEKLLSDPLPSLALPVGEIDKSVQKNVANIMRDIPVNFRNKFSEVIVNDEKELTIIMSLKNRPSSAFLGKNDWDVKVEKLRKLVNYLDSRKKIPSVINLTNAKKVVVKFSDNI